MSEFRKKSPGDPRSRNTCSMTAAARQVRVDDPLFRDRTARELRHVVDGEAFRFRCTSCGNCCRGPGSVFFTPDELNAVFRYLELRGEEQARLRRLVVQGEENGYLVHRTAGACRFLGNDNRCTIYPVRPLQCRSFPFWPSTFADRSGLEATAKECPGTMSTDGAEFSLLATARRVNSTRRKFLEAQPDPTRHFMI